MDETMINAPGPPKARLLLVEDDASIRLGLEINLREAGYEVRSASDGPGGLRLALSLAPELIVLDLRLPGLHGLDLLSELRERGETMPVLVLSALGEERDKVAGLRRGADDYLTKPFGVLELLARVEALLRRSRGRVKAAVLLSFGDVSVDLHTRCVRRGDEELHLTPKEFDLLEVLLRSPGRVHTRGALLVRVWGRFYEGTERTVDNFMNNLRRKLEPGHARPVHLVTVRGKGYRFDP